MRKAEEWAADLQGGYEGHVDLLDRIRAIQSDAIKACAEKVAQLSNGEHRLHPAVEWSKMAKQTQEVAHWAFQNAAQGILSLLPKDTP